MEDFELQLKQVRLARPSKDMKERIFGREERAAGLIKMFHFRIPLSWAAVLVIAAGLAGGYVNQLLGGATADTGKAAVYVQIMRSASAQNALDFTAGGGEDWMDGEWSVAVDPPEEI